MASGKEILGAPIGECDNARAPLPSQFPLQEGRVETGEEEILAGGEIEVVASNASWLRFQSGRNTPARPAARWSYLTPQILLYSSR